MIFNRALTREFSRSALAVFLALLGILLTTQLIRLLTEAAGGKLVPAAVLALLGFSALNYLSILLSLTVFISVLMTLSRCYRDSEMVVWFSSGLPLTAFIRPVLIFSVPMVLAIGMLSMFLSPWALGGSAEYRQRVDSRNDLSRVTPGNFIESAGADRVYFVESVAGDVAKVKNVFVSSTQNGHLGVMVAGEGRTQIMPDGSRFLMLLNGLRYEGQPGGADYRVMSFGRYAIKVEDVAISGAEARPSHMSLIALMKDPTPENMGELVWRVGIPLSSLILALIAIPLSFINPRAGRSLNMGFAILIYMFYSNLISISQAWVRQEKLGFLPGLLGIHLVMLLAVIGLFWWRMTLISWVRWRK